LPARHAGNLTRNHGAVFFRDLIVRKQVKGKTGKGKRNQTCELRTSTRIKKPIAINVICTKRRSRVN